MTPSSDQREHEPNSLAELLSLERLGTILREESGLWPLVAVLGVVALTLATALLVLALQSHSAAAAAAVALWVLMTVVAVDSRRRRHGRSGWLLWMALAFWAISGAAAYALMGWGAI